MKICKAIELEDALFLKILLFGLSGVGKSTCAAQAPGPVLYIAAELNALSVVRQANPDADVVVVKTLADLREILRYLMGEGAGKYKTVVIDSLSEVQALIRNEMLAREVGKDVLTIQEWGKLGDKTHEIVRGFRELPCNLVVIALAEDAGDEGRRFIQPSLYGRASRDVPALLTLVGYAFKEPGDAQSPGTKYRVLFESSGSVVTKTMRGLSPKMEPDVQSWIDAIQSYKKGVTPEVVTPPEASTETPVKKVVRVVKRARNPIPTQTQEVPE